MNPAADDSSVAVTRSTSAHSTDTTHSCCYRRNYSFIPRLQRVEFYCHIRYGSSTNGVVRLMKSSNKINKLLLPEECACSLKSTFFDVRSTEDTIINKALLRIKKSQYSLKRPPPYLSFKNKKSQFFVLFEVLFRFWWKNGVWRWKHANCEFRIYSRVRSQKKKR